MKNSWGVNETLDYIFEELLPAYLLEEIVKNVRIPEYGSKNNLLNIREYVRRNYSPEDYYPTLINFLKESPYKNKLKYFLKEPEDEDDLESVAKSMLEKNAYHVYPDEIKIGDTFADVVGYRKKFKPKIKERPRTIGPFEIPLLTEEYTGREFKGYVFCGIELKTAKRDNDPLFRQILDYIEHFHYSFTVITPFYVLNKYKFIKNRMCPYCEEHGMGIRLIDKNRVIRTILEPEEKSPLKENTKYLEEKMGLK